MLCYYFLSMLVVTPVDSTAASYYFRGQGGGRWVGQGTVALGLEGGVAHRDLIRLLRGCHPGSGSFLAARKPVRRRAGWDLTLAAPKSLSLLAASATADRDAIAAAHQAAVTEVVDDLEQRLLTVRKAASPGGWALTAGAVAACFDHSSNGSGEPHLHSHLLLCNLGRDEQGTWSALSHTWWTRRQALGAVYQLGLRHHLRSGGLELDWRLHADGLGDLVGVPRAAVRSASGRSRAAALDRAAFQSEAGSGRASGIRSGATIQSRLSAPSQPAQPWQDRARAAGFGPAAADALVAAGRVGPNKSNSEPGQPHLEADMERAVTVWLARRRSSFRHEDVLVALAACAPGGLAARQAERWAERFCGAAIPLDTLDTRPTASRRWTTPMAQAADRRLIELVDRRIPMERGRHARERGGLPEVGSSRSPRSWTEVRPAAPQLLSGPGSVHILGAPPGWSNLLAHAAVLELAASAWRAAGLRVAVATSSRQAEIRWRTLTGIAPHRPGMGADVLVVDHSDRRSTAELLALLTSLKPTGSAVLVEGGTFPRVSWMHSDGLAWLGDSRGRVDPGPAPVWGEPLMTPRVEARRDPKPTAYPTAADAAGVLLADWAASGSQHETATLVGMGYPEVDGLNRAARALLARRGDLTGPELSCGGRVFQAGEQVVALRRLSGDLPRGCPLEVVAVGARQSGLIVSRQGIRLTVDRRAASHLGYRYAVTPGLATHLATPLLVLGPPSALGPQQGRVMAAAVSSPIARLTPELVATRHEPPSRGIEKGRRTEWEIERGGRPGWGLA